ncbi:MAG: hypothetical protein ABJA98_26905 [Acidobacteriota bacterium]
MRNVLTVFIASPSDLNPERRAAFEVTAELNETLKKINWSVDLCGWEDTVPGYGRPQAQINRDVERCDLFLGMLWRKWGTSPDKHSVFSSGFEEEFSIARSRRQNGNEPEIWMFFKAVEAAQLADPGVELGQVIAFRDSLISGKEILFKEFTDTDAWDKLLRKYLLEHVLDISNTLQSVPAGPSDRTASTSVAMAPASVVAPHLAAAKAQLAAFVDSLQPSIQTGDLDLVMAGFKDPDEARFTAVRGFLLTATLVAESRTSSSAFPTHELNTLYRYRERLHSARSELYLLFRTVLGDELDICPGWYWFKDFEDAEIIFWLLHVAAQDESDSARIASYSILRTNSIHPPGSLRESFLADIIRASPGIENAAWEYLVDIAKTSDLDFLEGASAGTWLERRTGWLRGWVVADRSPAVFLSSNPDPQLLTESVQRTIDVHIPLLSVENLRILVAMPSTQLQRAASKELRARGTVVSESQHTKSGTLASFLETRGPAAPSQTTDTPFESDEERRSRLKHEPQEVLEEAIDWYSLDGPIAYRLLAERDPIDREAIRKDLLSQFARFKESSLERLRKSYGAPIPEAVVGTLDKLNDFVLLKFNTSAMEALEPDATADDVAIARQFIKRNLVKEVALRIVADHGNESDLSSLLEIARAAVGDERSLAIRGIRRIANSTLTAAHLLISDDSRELQRLGSTMLKDLTTETAVPYLRTLLMHHNADIRVVAVAELHSRVEKTSLVDFIREYVTQPTYYYNVVVWLDRLVYAPPIADTFYQNKLRGRFPSLI